MKEKCSHCYKNYREEKGKPCLMCGMPVETQNKFCSEECEIKYRTGIFNKV